MTVTIHHKDEILDRLAAVGNVAQFVAFRPDEGPRESFSRIRGRTPNDPHHDLDAALEALLASSAAGSVNVRSYTPEDPRSREFVYGIRTLEEARATVTRLASEGLHLIVNETIDVGDGGVSGVVQGGLIEFAPDDTPRCVERPGVAALPLADGLAILETVYGFAPDLPGGVDERTEFSIHPRACGWRSGHTLLWEHETVLAPAAGREPSWPNRFSRLIGDKAFGLMVADRLGVFVPRSLVIGRRVAPFSFGRPTGSSETWTRTCPVEPQPGLYTTLKGWTDPFRLMTGEDPDGDVLASVIHQDAVHALWSGGALVSSEGEVVIEGRSGEGDGLMLGAQTPQPLPSEVRSDVLATHGVLSARLGAVRIEWVHDGARTWVVQLHRGASVTRGDLIVPGDAARWVDFHVPDGLAKLRDLLAALPAGTGVNVVGEVGLTSHVADLLRREGTPSRLAAAPRRN